jgi:hypothetical protein
LIWDYHNEVVHGKTIKEQQAKAIKAAQTKIKSANEEYEKDHFIIPNHLHYLFTSRSLSQRFHQDKD